MPIAVKDFVWGETELEVSITLPLKGVKGSKADIFSSDQYIKVHYPPYIFEVHLFAPVVEEQCTVRIGNGAVHFRLVKLKPGVWGRLASEESGDKDAMVDKRTEAVERAHKMAEETRVQKAKQRREEEQFAIKQQMKLEEEERERIEGIKRQERDKADRELEEWKEGKQRKPNAVKETSSSATEDSSRNRGKKDGAIWREKGPISKPPPPRSTGKIEIHFTPRPFPTAARESKALEEQEWLTKMAAARKIKPPEKGDDKNVNERNPVFLKDRGVEFFKAGNYEAAVNAFTEALRLNPDLPQLFSNRAACFLATGNNDRCISDCCRALDLLYPVVPSNHSSRAKVFVRRGTAYANVDRLDLAVQDYSAALKLLPDDDKLREDCVRLKEAFVSEHANQEP